jgi:hypothetical protein
MHLRHNSIAFLKSGNPFSNLIDFSWDVAVKYKRPARDEKAGSLDPAYGVLVWWRRVNLNSKTNTTEFLMYRARHTRERVDGKGFDTDDELALSSGGEVCGANSQWRSSAI